MANAGPKADLLAGLMFMGFGAGALVFARDLSMGSAFRMGPGYFPTALAGLLLVLGAVVAGRSFRSGGERLGGLAWRPLVAVAVAILVFAFFGKRFGLAVTTFLLVALSRLARPENPRVETAVLAAALAAACALVFHFGLSLQIPLWPRLG